MAPTDMFVKKVKSTREGGEKTWPVTLLCSGAVEASYSTLREPGT
jgi:hypothetical protein